MHNNEEHSPNAFDNHEILRNYLRTYQGSVNRGCEYSRQKVCGEEGLGNLLQPDFYNPTYTRSLFGLA